MNEAADQSKSSEGNEPRNNGTFESNLEYNPEVIYSEMILMREIIEKNADRLT